MSTHRTRDSGIPQTVAARHYAVQEDHSRTTTSLVDAVERVKVLAESRQLAKARDILAEAVELGRHSLGIDHELVMTVQSKLALIELQLENGEAAVLNGREAFNNSQRRLGSRDEVTTLLAWRLFMCLMATRTFEENFVFEQEHLHWLLSASADELTEVQKAIRWEVADVVQNKR